jgi:hypothetical protein
LVAMNVRSIANVVHVEFWWWGRGGGWFWFTTPHFTTRVIAKSFGNLTHR